MTVENVNPFDEMIDEAIDDITSETENSSSSEGNSNPYFLNKGLLDKGHDFDFSGVYFHFNEGYQTFGLDEIGNFKTQDNIYLKVSRNQDKKLEIVFTWCIKENDKYIHRNSFKIDFLLNTGDEKEIKALNKKVSFAGGKNKNPASDGTYVHFVDDLLSQIVENDCLDVFKELDFEFPEAIDEDEDVEDDLSDFIQSFDEYPEDIKVEALKLSKEGNLFKELQKSVSVTHQGHENSRNALILQEASVFVGDGVHGLLDGDSGAGKSDLSFVIGYNFPDKYVKILRNISPKNIYYDCESYNDDYNILIFDDLPLNEDMINILKELADNTKKVKELKTVINGKSQTFRLKGKFIVILTYAKKIPDEELANRLFNIGVIVEDGSEKPKVKHKIRDNNVIGGNTNPLIERSRLIIKASIHDLIEKEINVFNPFLSIFNPEAYNNRDVNHFINMVKSKSLFEYYNLKRIEINDDFSITIGSYEDFRFVNDIWSEDAEAQRFKLSEKQKSILKLLPEYTQDEAFDYVEGIKKEYDNIQSRKAKSRLLDDVPTLNFLSKELGMNKNTLRNLLDKSSEHSTVKSLIENNLADKIQLDENNSKSPNIYYKIKNDGNALISQLDNVEDVDFQFQHYFNHSLGKQKVIINLLYYCNILINEKGYIYLKNYCDNHEEKIALDNYDSYFNLLEGFFDGLNYDECCIELEKSSLHDLNEMIRFNDEITKAIHEKIDGNDEVSDEDNFNIKEGRNEKSSNQNQDDIKILNKEININNINKISNEAIFDDIGVDVNIAMQIYDLLSAGEKTLDEIRNSICKFLNPDDVDSHSLALKVEVNMKKLEDNDFIKIASYSKGLMKYCLDDKFIEAFHEGDD